MKKTLLYFLPLVALFIFGCGPKKTTLPVPAPEGTFSGQFMFLHLHSKTGVIDTLRANLVLQMEAATGYKVTGDTSTVHAGSYGGYVVNIPTRNISFVDATFPPTGTPAKIHLSGVYDYTYDGSNLQLVVYGPQDTLLYYYNMKKTN